MARTRQVTEENGKLWYTLTRSRKIEVPGTKGLEKSRTVKVPQLPSTGSIEVLLESAINIMEGDSDAKKTENLIEIINSGLISTATMKVQNELNAELSENKAVDNFSSMVKLLSKMEGYKDKDESELADLVLEKFPDIAEMLKEAGLEPAGNGSVEETKSA